jgi:hypothetical protein
MQVPVRSRVPPPHQAGASGDEEKSARPQFDGELPPGMSLENGPVEETRI